MKHCLLSLAALTVAQSSAPALAQSVTLYGIADLAVEHLTQVNAAGASLTRQPNLSGSVPSRLGLRGSEDLGGGLRALFALEGGVALDSGGIGNGGRFWGRFAHVGLAGSWGTVTLGRLANMTFAAAGMETLGGNLYSNASLDGYIPNARSDNAIGYLGTFNGLTLGATYSLGRDTVSGAGPAATNCPGEAAGDNKACRQWTALLRYETKAWGLVFAHDRMNGGPGATLGLGNSGYTDTRRTLNGFVVAGGAKVSAGLLHRQRRAADRLDSDLMFVGVSYPLTPQITLDAQLSRLDIKRSANDASMLAARASYALSRRSSVYAMAGQMRNSGTSAVSLSAGATVGAGLTQTGVAAGIRHVF